LEALKAKLVPVDDDTIVWELTRSRAHALIQQRRDMTEFLAARLKRLT